MRAYNSFQNLRDFTSNINYTTIFKNFKTSLAISPVETYNDLKCLLKPNFYFLYPKNFPLTYFYDKWLAI